MLGYNAIVVALAVLAATASTSPVSGALASIDVGASGTRVSIDTGNGAVTTLALATTTLIRERAVGEQWQTTSVGKLKTGEPVSASLDAAGHVSELDAQFALVDTRAVIVQAGFLVGTDGVARRLIGSAAAVTAVPLGAYVELKTDPATGAAFDAAISSHPFAGAASVSVAVTLEVRVPVNTPPGSTIYLATNAQNWTANAVRLTPETGNRWTATVNLAAGTVLQYKYTRGSWSTGERDAAGADIPDRTLTTATTAKTQTVEDVVLRWADLPS
jgi:hypothetical protein